MSLEQIIALIASILTIVSVCANIIQYFDKRQDKKRLRAFAQGGYMDQYLIARACTRLRANEVKDLKSSELIALFWKEIQYINGISDSSRNNIVAVSESLLSFTPKFKHPAFPEVSDFSENIKLGTRVDTKE